MTRAYFMEEVERFIALLGSRDFWCLSDDRRHLALFGLWYVGTRVTEDVGQILRLLTEEYTRREQLIFLHGIPAQ
jgi:hypothetical protein